MTSGSALDGGAARPRPGGTVGPGAGATGPRRGVLVFSDVDETLIDCKSPWDFLAFHLTWRYGPAGALRARRQRERVEVGVRGGMPREAANRAYFRCWAGEPVAAVRASGARWFARVSTRTGFFHPATRAALAAHRARGATLVLVSGSCPAVLHPIAAAVGAAQVLCARPATRGGVFTGGLVGGPMIGAGKREAVRAVLRARPEVAARDCFGYGDHVSDLPMLREVGHPVLVGAGEGLARLLPRASRLPTGAGEGVT